MERVVQIKCIIWWVGSPLLPKGYSAFPHPSNTHYHSHRCTECQLQLHICDLSIISIVKQYKIWTSILTVKPNTHTVTVTDVLLLDICMQCTSATVHTDISFHEYPSRLWRRTSCRWNEIMQLWEVKCTQRADAPLNGDVPMKDTQKTCSQLKYVQILFQ